MTGRCKFGTDGIRGLVGEEPMVPDTLVRLGYAIGTVLGGSGREVVIGKDTRLSGYMVESAIEAGLVAAGMDTALTGPLPTSAIARLVAEEKAAAGIVISASHNPFRDNGVKIFDGLGNKLTDEMESDIERIANDGSLAAKWSPDPGKARRIDEATERYVDFCLGTAKGLSLDGMHIVVDAANGAAYSSAPAVFRKAGAVVYEVGCEPDGRNINEGCGALAPQAAADAVTRHNFDLGVVLDGDGDRLLMVDSKGRVLDGDACLFVLCSCMKQSGDIPEGVVGTLVSNLALERTMEDMGVKFERSDVGDRNVSALLRKRGWNLGGEPSGHLLMLDRHVTGDGIIAALAVLQALQENSLTLAKVASRYQPLPSVSRNLKTSEPDSLVSSLSGVVEKAREDPGVGRVILRPSGTEPVLRLVVEADSHDKAAEVADKITSATPG